MSLLGLLFCGLGLGYAVHKDNQKFANMNREATRLYGREINESIDDMAIENKYFREIKKYFDERYEHYINDKEYIMNCTNIKDIHRNDVTLEQLQQFWAGDLAYDDMFRKYAPDYAKFHDMVFGTSSNAYSYMAFAQIARALARKELYRLGFCPSHMANMNCAIGGKNLYFYDGVGTYGRLYPSAWESTNWDINPFKYHGYTPINCLGGLCERRGTKI